MKKLFILFLTVFFFSCASVDIDKNIQGQNTKGIFSSKKKKQVASGEIPDINEDEAPAPEIIVVERPIFIPEKDKPATPPAKSDTHVKDTINKGIIEPSDYSHAAVIYDYNPDWVYEVYAMPLRVCDICLEPGERALEIPFVSDSERWQIGASVSLENNVNVQHIYVKPNATGQEASLIINTDRRVYRIILRSYKTVFMPIVRWRYVSGLPENYISANGTPTKASQTFQEGKDADSPFSGIDPRYLSFNYRISYGFLSKPTWLPELVFDDGSKTYITFPDQVLQKELPSVFENRKDIVNYRVMGKLIIIDKLVETITVKIERKEIVITKKKR